MKKIIVLISLASLLVGCAHVPVASNNTVNVPNKIDVSVEGKPLAQLATLSGETLKVAKDTVTKVNGVETRKIDLTSAGISQDVKWFVLIGGVLSIVGLLVGFILKNWGIGAGLLASGLITAIGTVVIQALIKPIMWAASIALFIGAVYEVYANLKTLGVVWANITVWFSKLFAKKPAPPAPPTTPPAPPTA